jgi:hypothetical protein
MAWPPHGQVWFMNGQVWFMRSVALGGPVEPADSATAGGGHGHPRARRAAWIVAAILFAAAPWASLGLATPLAFLLAAALFSRLHRAHASMLWISAAVYTAALAVQIAHENSPSGAILGLAIILTFVVGGLQALVTVALAARGPGRILAQRPTYDVLRRQEARIPVATRNLNLDLARSLTT